MARFRILTLASAFMAAGWLTSVDARAQCLESNPEMVCPLAVCQSLQAVVVALCTAPPAPLACRKVSGCEALKAMRQRWVDCRDARLNINTVCFSGGNAGHQTAVFQVILNIRNCEVRMAMPAPEGCGEGEDECR